MAPGRYAASIDQRSGGCCSASCGARSTVATISLDLRVDGTARLEWTRRGCNVTLSGDGPMHMPNDPGSPDALCAARPDGASSRERRQVIDLTGQGRIDGTWTRDGGAMRVTLSVPGAAEPWSILCARSGTGRELRAPFACASVRGAWSELLDFTVDSALYLDVLPVGRRASTLGPSHGLTVHVRVPGFGASRRVEISR